MVNTKKIEEILMTSIFEVFEKMFFVFFEHVKGNGGPYNMRAGINFDGPVNGEMEILFSNGIAETMVKNMLNLEHDKITNQITADCMKESINIICGNFVRKLDSEKGFHLSIPTFEMIPEDMQGNRLAEAHELRLTFAAETGNVEVAMTAKDVL